MMNKTEIKKVWSILLSEIDFDTFTDRLQLNFFIKEWIVEKETPKTMTIIIKNDKSQVVERLHLKKENAKKIADTFHKSTISVVSLTTYVDSEDEIENAKKRLLDFYENKITKVKENLNHAEKMLLEIKERNNNE